MNPFSEMVLGILVIAFLTYAQWRNQLGSELAAFMGSNYLILLMSIIIGTILVLVAAVSLLP